MSGSRQRRPAGPSASRRRTGRPGPGDVDGGPRETRREWRRRSRETDPQWWRGAVIYQVYPRSFADGNGDGTGDLAGVRSRLPYLRDLGVDAIWFTPWYVSPLADGGYDVADYRAIDPAFGTLEEAEQLIAEALALGHPDDHRRRPQPRLRPARVVPGGARRRPRLAGARAVLVPPRQGRARRARSRRSWVSDFQGSTWTRTTNPDGTPGEWYLHLFAPQQPDLNWEHPDVVAEFEDVLRFWFDRGVARHPHRLGRAAGQGRRRCPRSRTHPGPGEHPYVDRDELHDVYRGWRAVADSYDGHARPRRRGLAAGQGAVRAVPAPRRDAHRVQLRLPGPPVGRQAAARVDRHHARRARPGRRPGHLGAVQPRRHPAGHPVRPRGHLVRVHRQALRHPDRPGPSGLRRARAAALLTAALPGLALHLPGRRAGPARGRGPAAGPAPGPDALPLRGRRPRPRRLPGAAALVGYRRAVRVRPAGATRAVAAAARRPGRT